MYLTLTQRNFQYLNQHESLPILFTNLKVANDRLRKEIEPQGSLYMYFMMSCLRVSELRDAFGNYAEGGQIFLRDIGPVVRCVKGLKPAESEVREMMTEAEKSGTSSWCIIYWVHGVMLGS